MSGLKMKSISEIAKKHPDLYKKYKATKGVCKVCGCTENNACIHPNFGACWWLNDNRDICSHCVELPDDPRVEKFGIKMRERNLKMCKKS